MKKSLPTVTIATIAYNEAENILPFLRSVLAQKEQDFRINSVVIISDGSTDDTVKRAQSLSHSKLVIRAYKTRLGKSTRLNQLYRSLTTDFLVQSDTDVIYAHPLVVRDITLPLHKFTNVAMCGGNSQPLPASTFIEQAVNSSVIPYVKLRKIVRSGCNVFSADGRILAYKRELVKKIIVPENMIANDMYTYFCCLHLGFTYRFVPQARVHFRSPQTLLDHIRQNTRFRAAPIRMYRYFPASLVRRELGIPKATMIEEIIKVVWQYPLHCAVICLLNLYCRIKATLIEKQLDSRWAVAQTTKSLKLLT